MDLIPFCELFYASHYIPVSLYHDDVCIGSYKSIDEPLSFCYSAEKALLQQSINPAVFSSAGSGLYGKIQIKNTCDAIIIGPTFSNSISNDAVISFMRENLIGHDQKDSTALFLSMLPKYTYNQFINLLSFLDLELNNEKIDIISHFQSSLKDEEPTFNKKHALKTIERNETQQLHGTYQTERKLLALIRDGNIKGVNDLLMKIKDSENMVEGTLADDPLRQAKNLLIGLVTLVGKVAAIEGGMHEEEAYNLIDQYIQECEKSQSIEFVKNLQYNLIIDFTDRIAQSLIPGNLSKEIYECIQYIRNHTCSHITIDDVAKHVSVSRSYITKRFKTETGLTINEYILQQKIKESKYLLQYSNLSISAISNYLSFSSQSYFQTLFKNQVKETPYNYRKSVTINNITDISKNVSKD